MTRAVLLVSAGVLLTAIGCALIYPPLGLIVVGASLATVGLLIDVEGREPRSARTPRPF